MPIKTKRWDDKKGPDDGWRILICRYRPRALPKKKETWSNWYPDLGPSRQLHADFYGKSGAPIGWDDYRRRYLEEMQSQRDDARWRLWLEIKQFVMAITYEAGA